jgi:ABC-2 type transport system ATP-binding protein
VTSAVDCVGLSKRYGRHWAIQDCDLSIPRGRVVALIGPNGAGKTTLLEILAGLRAPTSGDIRIFGIPIQERTATLPRVGFLAQDRPLYASFLVRDLLTFGAHLNPAWDDAFARDRLEHLGIEMGERLARLSGGQQAQVALTMTLAKRPDLLLFDEPLANLDPLARRDVTRALLDATALNALTVVISSHVVAELVGVCDYIVILQNGHVQVTGDIDDLLERHVALTGPREAVDSLDTSRLVHLERSGDVARVVLAGSGTVADPRWVSHPMSMEELILAYLQAPSASALPGPERALA